MVSRHLTVPYKFTCLTDNPTPIEGVELIVQPSMGYAKGWWHKVHMFDPGLPLQGRILYFDLDVVIHNNINKLVTDSTEFFGIRDFNRKFSPTWNTLNSSALSWIAGTQSDIYLRFKSDPSKAQRLHGDQDWIWQIAKDRIKFWPDAWLQSYKWEIRNKGELIFQNGQRRFKTVRNPEIPKDCSVAVFHGDPNPHEIQDPYVVDNWK
jgi:hypothetical protein